MMEKSSWLRRYKTSILLARSGTCGSTYGENERTISLAVCALLAQIRLFSPPIGTQNLIVLFLFKQTPNQIFPLHWHSIHQIHATNRKRNRRKKIRFEGAVQFFLRAVQPTGEQNVIHIIMTSKGISSQCDCEDANSVNGAWNCLLLLAWHSISSSWVYVLGFAVGSTHYSTPCTCPHLTTPIPFNGFPPLLPSLHKYNQPCQERQYHLLLPLLFLIDYAEQPSLHPPIPPPFEFHWSWLDARGSSPILPVPTLWPHSVPTYPYITLVDLRWSNL